ncbi:UNVERIFIED_CONTAM: hypothetical protein PYX00_001736 [Menopon gallinae]|uniref:UDENN domain-containing protein n=1 Tax=Menopon gallinae TaxID=328185 RepID=A0AAW2IE88_9NEOP
MPDGAHNYEHDAVYFHLPSLNGGDNTIFGVSCFQQIPIEKVKKRTTDMTRGTVQKAVCILSTLPLFGYIQIKMELVTAAFFDEGDFSNVSLLKDAFHHLNDCLNNSHSQHLFDGLSVRDLVLKFRHRVLLLFKLMLLERRVVFFHSPVKPLCCTLLSLISLHPGLLEKGLFKSFSSKKSSSSPEKEVEEKVITKSESFVTESQIESVEASKTNGKDENTTTPCLENNVEVISNEDRCNDQTVNDNDNIKEDCVNGYFIENYFDEIKSVETLEVECSGIPNNFDLLPGGGSNINHDIKYFENLNIEDYGLPLSIFTEGNLCLPYISISYLDFLTNPEVVGFHGGAANLLFKQKKQIIDVLVELESSKIETSCPELRRQLFLTTEDLRFGERLIRGVIDPSSCEADFPANYTNEEWIRMQFTIYMLSLLRTSLMEEGSKELDQFNVHFINAWKKTKNYQNWLKQEHKSIWELNPGHPFVGNLSVSDVRLRFSQAITNTESGRRINQAVTSTGKAVGGAIVHARGALTHWWNTLTTPEAKPARALNNI